MLAALGYFGNTRLFTVFSLPPTPNVGITRGSAGTRPEPKYEAMVAGSDCNHLLGVALSENALSYSQITDAFCAQKQTVVAQNPNSFFLKTVGKFWGSQTVFSEKQF